MCGGFALAGPGVVCSEGGVHMLGDLSVLEVKFFEKAYFIENVLKEV